MLLESMNPIELTSEILNDYAIVRKSIDRLKVSYDKFRRKGNVSRKSIFSKSYEIKSKKKNNWLFFISKTPKEPYKGSESIYTISIVYYFSKVGLRVFRIIPEGVEPYKLIIYNGHLFKRYNERMNLGLIEPLDIIKHFFSNNGHFFGKIFNKEGREFNMGICRDGLILGELQEEREWLVNMTFITNEQTRPDQEAELLNGLREETNEDWENDSFFKAEILALLNS